MRRGVPFHMTVILVLGHHYLKLRRNILDDAGVGVFVDHNPGRGVRHENVANTALNSAGLHDIADLDRNVLKFHL